MYYLIVGLALAVIVLSILLVYSRLQVNRYRDMAMRLGQRGRRLDGVVADLRGIIKGK